MPPYYLTTPIYYVNDLPHIGHIFTTIVADTLARYRRMSGDDVRFLTGTDEHGQNIERAAAREGVTEQQLADKVVARYHELWKTFGISHDDFIRTTEPRHEQGVRELIRRIDAAGDLYLAKHEGWYCSPCELYYTEKELAADQKCPVHGAAVEWKSEENVFFRLAKYQQPLLDWIDSHPEAIRPETRRNEVRSFVESGLRDLSVSRTGLEWGIPFPGYPGHTVYVWLDALANYITALGFGAEGATAGVPRVGRGVIPDDLVSSNVIVSHMPILDIVEPDIDGVPGIARERDPPFESRPAHGEVSEARFDERSNFVSSRLGVDRLWMAVDPVEQRLLVLRQAEEDILFRLPFDRGAVHRALLVRRELLLGVVELAG